MSDLVCDGAGEFFWPHALCDTQLASSAKLPYTAVRDSIFTDPTYLEGLVYHHRRTAKSRKGTAGCSPAIVGLIGSIGGGSCCAGDGTQRRGGLVSNLHSPAITSFAMHGTSSEPWKLRICEIATTKTEPKAFERPH